MKLGTAEGILQCVPRVTRFDSQYVEAGGTSASCVNSIVVNNSTEMAEVRTKLERRLAHLVLEERQISMPVTNEYLDDTVMALRECYHTLTKGLVSLGQGTPCILRRTLTVYRMHYERR